MSLTLTPYLLRTILYLFMRANTDDINIYLNAVNCVNISCRKSFVCAVTITITFLENVKEIVPLHNQSLPKMPYLISSRDIRILNFIHDNKIY